MNRRSLLLAMTALAAAWLPIRKAAASSSIQLFKDPSCDCCTGHAAYLQQQGFVVEIIETADLPAVKSTHGIPDELAGCHTILIDRYVVEGHVPASAIRKLLAERPAIKGISLPGMPLGSPGMSGEKEGPLQVVVIGDGMPRVFFTE